MNESLSSTISAYRRVLSINGGSLSIKFALFEVGEPLRRLSPFDPEHLPAELKLIEAVQQRFPELPQVACFDTVFQHDMPRVAQLLPIPRRYEAQGVRRYGFHGLSYEFLMQELCSVTKSKNGSPLSQQFSAASIRWSSAVESVRTVPQFGTGFALDWNFSALRWMRIATPRTQR